VNQADRAGTEPVGDDGRNALADVEQLTEQRQRAPEHAAFARYAGRCDEHEPPNTRGVLPGELGREQPAERVPDDVDLLELRSVEKTDEPRRELAGADSTEPRQPDEMQPVPVFEQFGDLRPPPPGARQAVQHEHVAPGARDAVVDGRSFEVQGV
jgi:hypothetical protein